MFSLKEWQEDQTWRNWTGNQVSIPEEKLVPESVDALQNLVRRAQKSGKSIRVTGSAHSFSGCAKSDEIAITLHRLRGIVDIDHEKKEVTLWAGTYLHEIGPLLRPHNLALENMGDIQNQTIAGAVSTGTHGTGISLGSVSSQIVGWQWIDGKGDIHEHRRGDDDLSMALHISLGLLGIVTQVTVRCIPLYGLLEASTTFTFEPGLAQFMSAAKSHRHMEWFLFPGTNLLQQKTLDYIPPTPMTKTQKVKDEIESRVVLNGGFYLISEAARFFPPLVRGVSQLTALSIPNTIREGYYYEVFPKPRGVVFNESEYFIPLDRYEDALRYFNKALLKNQRGSHFPIEVRTHKGESGFLSPTQGVDSLVLSFHVYRGINSAPLFNWLAQEMRRWEGRPHWGKVHRYGLSELRQLYPQIDTFRKLRKKYDPDMVFMNPWAWKRFGE